MIDKKTASRTVGQHAWRLQHRNAGGPADGRKFWRHAAAAELKHTLLAFEAFHDVAELAASGNVKCSGLLCSHGPNAEWFTNRAEVPASIKVSVFKVTGETNTDDLSPAPDAWSRPDIPLHALAMYKMTRDGLLPQEHGVAGPYETDS